MSAKRIRLSDQIRQAVDASGLRHCRICREFGLDQAVFSRFMAGKSGLSVKNLDALADVLGLDVVARGPVKVQPPQRPGFKAKKGR
jgi:transcriptional regulator with XRE-family HTH domain